MTFSLLILPEKKIIIISAIVFILREDNHPTRAKDILLLYLKRNSNLPCG